MGNKIITEKDFWKCSSGAAFAQLQGTRTSNKKSTGEVYITVADTSTSSWIDFGCTKNMLLAAVLGAVVAIVIAVAVVAFVVGTGGLGAIALIGIGGMMAIGATGGVIGGLVVAAKGAMQCGHKNANARTWDASKDDLALTRTPAITGNRTMTCTVGGVVKFAPEVKSWMHALALSGLNYITELAGCALGGAGVGALVFGGAGVAGGSLAVGWPTLPSILTNVGQGFTGIWGSSRVLFGLDNIANEHAMGNVEDGKDAFWASVNGGVPEIGMAQRIFTGQAQPTDYMLFLYLLNIKAKTGKPPVEETPGSSDKDGSANPNEKTEQNKNKTPEEEGVGGNKGKTETEGQSKENKPASAFEANPYKKPSFEDFKKTVDGGFPSDEIAQKAYDLFNKGDWKGLESLFAEHSLNGGWPPNRGAMGTREMSLKPGDQFDRFGGWIDENGMFQDKGAFVAKDGAPYTDRALPKGTDSKPYRRYKVVEEIPGVKEGEAIPWFGEKGGGIQYELPANINDLIKEGYIVPID
ncbi:TNT domain-containing protein [Chryseobacterium sp. NRRL B-14859]|uniref:TNT domain-containing protein n=1 Tax=Chryseobacterium sp. NRRL B-14859 TaxID=1562763 RepID=UPI003398A39C